MFRKLKVGAQCDKSDWMITTCGQSVWMFESLWWSVEVTEVDEVVSEVRWRSTVGVTCRVLVMFRAFVERVPKGVRREGRDHGAAGGTRLLPALPRPGLPLPHLQVGHPSITHTSAVGHTNTHTWNGNVGECIFLGRFSFAPANYVDRVSLPLIFCFVIYIFV